MLTIPATQALPFRMGCLQGRNRSGGIVGCGLFDDGVLTLLYLEQLPRYFHVRTRAVGPAWRGRPSCTGILTDLALLKVFRHNSIGRILS
jgi:hypothetical protein